MSGHSKWANIQRTKNAQDKKRSGIFTKLAKNIMVAARDGKDPDMNFKLRMAIDKARQYNMPKDNIERAVLKGAGELPGQAIMEVTYEGYGPGGAALLVETTSDNKNRTASNIRAIFNKHGGSLGSANSVRWMFDRMGVLTVNKEDIKNPDEFMLNVIEAGAKDVSEDDPVFIYTDVEDFFKVKDYLEKQDIKTQYAQLDYIAKDEIETDGETAEKLRKMMDILFDDDDVGEVYTNVKL